MIFLRNIDFLVIHMANKQKNISEVYFDRSGFGSRKTTLEDSRKKDSSIKMEDVERFVKENVEAKGPQQNCNSYVAPHNRHTYQIDLTFFSPSDFDEKQKYSVALTCIDVLSKYAVAIPVRSKEAPDVIAGTMQAINKMGGKPKMIYAHDEKAVGGRLFQEYVEGEGIEQYRTKGRPAFIERWNRSLKDMILKRVEADEKKNKKLFSGCTFRKGKVCLFH